MTAKQGILKGIIDVKGKIWLRNIKYLRLSTEHIMLNAVFIYIQMCVEFQCEMLMIEIKNIGISKKINITAEPGILNES